MSVFSIEFFKRDFAVLAREIHAWLERYILAVSDWYYSTKIGKIFSIQKLIFIVFLFTSVVSVQDVVDYGSQQVPFLCSSGLNCQLCKTVFSDQ